MVPFEEMPDHSRVWIYQSDRAFDADESEEVLQLLKQFVHTWKSHNVSLKASADLIHDRFVVIAVDHHIESPSGCSIDASVQVIKEIEQRHNVRMFDRMLFAWMDENNQVQVHNRVEFVNLHQAGKIKADTIVFNNLVQTLAEMKSKWAIQLSQSWHQRML